MSIPPTTYPANIEKIGHLNIAGALHPVVLADGRIMFSSLESQGIRSEISWGIWTIHPDGTNWGPLVSAFDPGGASNGFHFQTQLRDRIAHHRGVLQPEQLRLRCLSEDAADAAEGLCRLRPGKHARSAEYAAPVRTVRQRQGEILLAAVHADRGCFVHAVCAQQRRAGGPAVLKDKNSPKVGKFTHPSGAPDNHLLTIWSPGPVNHQYTYLPQIDGGIYLIKDGKVVEEPGQMRLIKNDPNYNESWPRAVVPYRRDLWHG